ncbi:MAG: NAD(P)H-dependent oxidoreductase [Pseudomonadota bacterium]
MKVMAINSSPRVGVESKTEILLNHLVQGLEEGGAEVGTVNLKGKKINNCAGCFQCWTKTPGVCIHHDDMSRELFPLWLDSDLAIYATPLYNYSVTATMKAFMERCLPVLQPFIEFQGERAYHPLRRKAPDAAVLSVAGFPGLEHFGPLSSLFNHTYATSGRGLRAELYVSCSETLGSPLVKKEREELAAALVQAGRELAAGKKVSAETLAVVSRPLVGPRPLAEMANFFWRSCIEQAVTPREFSEQGLVPRPDSIETFLLLLRFGFNPTKAGQTRAVLEFVFSGQAEGVCHAVIENGAMAVGLGPAPSPNLTVKAPFETWIDVMTGRTDGAASFMEGKYTVEGDGTLLPRLGEFFGR